MTTRFLVVGLDELLTAPRATSSSLRREQYLYLHTRLHRLSSTLDGISTKSDPQEAQAGEATSFCLEPVSAGFSREVFGSLVSLGMPRKPSERRRKALVFNSRGRDEDSRDPLTEVASEGSSIILLPCPGGGSTRNIVTAAASDTMAFESYDVELGGSFDCDGCDFPLVARARVCAGCFGGGLVGT